MGPGAGGGELPRHIGRYTVERELGSGGMGTVYLARSRGGRTVAVKVARPELAADPHFRARFRSEVRTARKVGGFHTAPVVDADPDAAAPWLATAYVAGPTLSELIAERGPMNGLQLRLFGAALAEALEAIHACDVVHRDLKPGNIIMADDGPRVLDFGIARALESTRITSTGAAFGTPGFLAPEQAQGRDVGAAADVFALGAVLVAAAGGSAFGEGAPVVLMYRAVHESPDLSALPPDVRTTVAGCLAKDPAQRPTPARLLELFTPDTDLSAPAPTVSAEPSEPTPASRVAPRHGVSATADADTRHNEPRHDEPRQPPSPHQAPEDPEDPGGQAPVSASASAKKKRTRLFAAGAVGALLVTGGLGYAVHKASTSDAAAAAFPKATHKLITPGTVMGGAYERGDGWEPPADKVPDSVNEKDTTSLSASYDGTGKGATFEQVEVSGLYGRLKHPERQRNALMASVSRTGEEEVVEPRKKVRVSGSDVSFSCETVSSSEYSTMTLCAWADSNTAGCAAFTPNGPFDSAAKETSRIRDDMRKPID